MGGPGHQGNDRHHSAPSPIGQCRTTYGAWGRTSGAIRSALDGRIQLPPVPASSWHSGHFLTAVFSGGAAEGGHRRRLLCALLASLLLHALLWTLPRPTPGGAAAGAPRPGAAAVVASLRAAVGEESPATAPPPVLPPQRVGEPPPAAEADADAADAAIVVTALGERRLAAYVPPWLTQPGVVHTPAGVWYFPRAELTLPPALESEPVLSGSENAGSAGPARGKVVLRVLVGADGAVERVEVERSELPAAVAEAAVAAFSRVRFRPGEIEGVAVTSEARFAVDFDVDDFGSSKASDRSGVRELRSRGGAAAAQTSPAGR